MKFYNYLNEKTYAIGADVDYIYNKAFKKIVKDFEKDWKKTIDYLITERTFITIPSTDLKSRQSKKASEIKPILIFCGSFSRGNFYRPAYNEISLSINRNAVQYIYDKSKFYDNLKEIVDMLPQPSRKSIINSFKEADIKGTIYHELSHWLNDVFHNQHISKKLQKSKETHDISVLQKHGTTLFTDYEIDAQVHALKQIKRNYKKEWDNLTWMDIIEIKSSFEVIFKQLKSSSKKVQEEYRKNLTKRLNREKLLGRAMQVSFYDAIKDI
jgi:hypothetical protein